MKLYLKIVLPFILIFALTCNCFADPGRWGTQSSFVQGTVIGTNTSMSSKSIGVDPLNSFAYTYSTVQTSAFEQNTRDGMALGIIESGNSALFDLAQCNDLYFPSGGDTMVYMVSRSDTDAQGVYHGYYGTVIFHKDPMLYTNSNEPEIVPDIMLYEIPRPRVYTNGDNNFISWDLPEIQETSQGNPIAGYNLYYTNELTGLPSKINGTLIPFGNNSFTDFFRYGYYAISLVMINGAETMEIFPGPDMEPGFAGVDDNGNGQFDETAELGFGDDVFKSVHSAYSNLCNTAGQQPPEIMDAVLINSDGRIYLQWSKSPWANIHRYEIFKNGGFYSDSFITTFVDGNAANGDIYDVRAVTADGFSSPPGNSVAASPFNGSLDSGDFSQGEALLFPAWSKAPIASFGDHGVAYAANSAAENDTWALFMADLSGNSWKIFDQKPVFWASRISGGDGDSQIYFTLIDDGHTKIAAQEASSATTNTYTIITPGWGNWTDPDWTDDLNQYTLKPMLAFAVDYDIWVCDPTDPQLSSGEGLYPLTDFSAADSTFGSTITCYQPVWSPDNNAIAFIARSPEDAAMVSYSDVFIINDVQTLIEDIDLGGVPIQSLGHPYLERVTFMNYPGRDKPIWCPSWSNDSTMISFCVDKNDLFNNYEFALSSSNALNLLATTNFDAWVWERNIGGWPVGYPEMDALDTSEGFVSWSPAGGNKFFFTKIDQTGSLSSINQFMDPSIKGESGGTKMVKERITDGYCSFSDSDMTSLILSSTLYEERGSVAIFPVEEEIKEMPAGKISLGASRHFYIGGHKATSEEFTIKMHYTRFQAAGFEELTIEPLFYSEAGWRKVENYKILTDEDNDPFNDSKDGGFVIINTTQPGYYALSKDDDDGDDNNDLYSEGDDLDNIISAPNPSRNGDPVYFVNIPQQTRISIFDLSGVKVADSTADNSLQWVSDHWEWVVKNDDLKDVASGIYIAVFEFEGRSARKKIAIIR